ncbi:hypothetical protein [Cutibacterium sp. V970]
MHVPALVSTRLAFLGTLCWFTDFVFWASQRFTKSTERQLSHWPHELTNR